VNRIFFTYTLHNFRFGEIRRRSHPSSLAILMARLAWTCSCATSAISRDRSPVPSRRRWPCEVIRLTQAEVEAHPAWQSFGDQAADHPPMRGWLATAVCGEGSYRHGLVRLSDKGGEGDFTAEDEVRLRALAELVGVALDALRFSHEHAAA
jgi:hypothetical protein